MGFQNSFYFPSYFIFSVFEWADYLYSLRNNNLGSLLASTSVSRWCQFTQNFPGSCRHAELLISGKWGSVNDQTLFKLFCSTAGGHTIELNTSLHIPAPRRRGHRGVPEKELPGSKVDWILTKISCKKMWRK